MEAIWLLAVLACPIVMGGSMIWMRRSMRRDATRSDTDKGRGEV